MKFRILLALSAMLATSAGPAMAGIAGEPGMKMQAQEAGGRSVADAGSHGMGGAGASGDLDLSTSKMTENHSFKVSLEGPESAPPLNSMHAWVLTVATPDGRPVDGAEITVDGGMPAHGHGLPTDPRVTRYLGDGRYLVEGVKFNMAGSWELAFTIAAGDDKDRVTFNLVIE